MTTCVVDTNVLVAANGRDTHADEKCHERCVEQLEHIAKHCVVVVDCCDLIVEEYMKHASFRPLGVGDAFLKHVFNNRFNPARVRRVRITRNDDDRRGFEELPANHLDRADRKFLATFYTLPESAALLAELAVGRIATDWSKPAALKRLRACDFACGTGTLITAAYHALLARHRRAGGDDAAVHRAMMERSIVAADLMPAATHLTISMLSSAHPTTPFEATQVHLLPYGRQEDAKTGFALGALDLIRKQHGTGLFENTAIEVHRGTGGAAGVSREGQGWSDTFLLEHESMDLVIMNPPFTRPTNHEATTVPVPSFAGLGNDAAEQAAMSRRSRTSGGTSRSRPAMVTPGSPRTSSTSPTPRSSRAACSRW